jgi:hypothetical protein
MKQTRRWVVGALTLLIIAWLATAGFIWSRNRMPPVQFPSGLTIPEGNVYEQYIQIVKSVQDRDALGGVSGTKTASPSAQRAALAKNASLLKQFHALVGKPSVVTALEPGVNFVAAWDFPHLSKLLVLEAQSYLPKHPELALNTLLDGLTFASDISRGGATLHLIYSYMATTPLVEALPTIIPKLPASSCEEGAKRMKQIIESRFPLSSIFENERRVRVGALMRNFQPMSTRIFRFQIPLNSYEWAYLVKPKTAAVESVNRYLLAWVEQGKRKPTEITTPTEPVEIKALMDDETLSEQNFGTMVLRYYWLDARFRIIYTALRLEAYRKKNGRYPPSLVTLGNDPLFTDPFSGKPLVYRSSGHSYTLYSVGPNGEDDGGMAYREGRMRRNERGDLLLQPTF